MRPQAGPEQRWGNVGLLMAVTAGFWCLFAALSAPEAPACQMSDASGADADCRGDFSQPFALVSTRFVGDSDRAFSPGSSSASSSADGLTLSRMLSTAAPSGLGESVWRSSAQKPLYHIAPKQSPPSRIAA